MDFEAFLIDVLTPILDHPAALRVEVKGEGRKIDVMIFAEPRDRGRIIGKSGCRGKYAEHNSKTEDAAGP